MMYERPSRGGGGAPPSTGANFHSNANPYHTQNPNFFPNFQFQNPSFPIQNPNFQFHAQPSRPMAAIDMVDRAVLKARSEILSTGYVVSAWKVSQAALVLLQVDTWDSLGFQMQQVPSLHRLMLIEGKVKSKKLVSVIGLKTQVTIDDALSILKVWTRSELSVRASLSQMSKFYTFIWNGISTSELRVMNDLCDGPFIFVPHLCSSWCEDAVSGVFLSSKEVFWRDPIDFTEQMKIVLLQLSAVALPCPAAKTVFLKWSEELKSGLLSLEDLEHLKDNLRTSLCTVQDKWVSLNPSFGTICWCDDDILKKEFKHHENIDFLHFGELTSEEKELLHSKVSIFMQRLGIPTL